MNNKLKERLAVGEELFCYDGRTQMEKVTVVEVNKEAKTAKLSNQIICSRYPDSKGIFEKQGAYSSFYTIKRVDDETEFLLKSYKSRKRVGKFLTDINWLLTKTHDITKSSQDQLETVIKLDKYLTKIFEK